MVFYYLSFIFLLFYTDRWWKWCFRGLGCCCCCCCCCWFSQKRIENNKLRLELGGLASAQKRYETAQVLQIENVVVRGALLNVDTLQSAVEAFVVGQRAAHESPELAERRVVVFDCGREAVVELLLEWTRQKQRANGRVEARLVS